MSNVYTVFDQKQKDKDQKEQMEKIVNEMEEIELPINDLIMEVSQFSVQYMKHLDQDQKNEIDTIFMHQFIVNLMADAMRRTIVFSMYCITLDTKFDTQELMKSFLKLEKQKDVIKDYHQLLIDQNFNYVFSLDMLFELIDDLRKDSFAKAYHAQKSLKSITLLPSSVLDVRKYQFNQYLIKTA